MIDTTKIAQLYYRYKQRKDDELKKFASRIVWLKKKDDKYYAFDEKSKKELVSKLRSFSINFGDLKTEEAPVENLVEYKTITFLVQSSSRFFLKADIGEVIDQLDFDDFHCPSFKAICVNGDEYKGLDGTEGEHFLMTATLFK